MANAARLAAKTLMWFAITALIAVLLGIGIGLVTNPGAHTRLSATATATATYSGGSGPWLDFIGSAATAGLTGSIVMLILTLSTLGLPQAGVGLLIAIDPIMDMIRTATNVAGQALVPTLVAKEEGILDLDRYNSEHGAGRTAVDKAEPTRVDRLPDSAPARERADNRERQLAGRV